MVLYTNLRELRYIRRTFNTGNHMKSPQQPIERKAIPRTLQEIGAMKMAPEFRKQWQIYMAENKELSYKKNKKYMLMINAIAKRNFTQDGELDIYKAHNQAIDLFTEE